jgi:hypothetical protein
MDLASLVCAWLADFIVFLTVATTTIIIVYILATEGSPSGVDWLWFILFSAMVACGIYLCIRTVYWVVDDFRKEH